MLRALLAATRCASLATRGAVACTRQHHVHAVPHVGSRGSSSGFHHKVRPHGPLLSGYNSARRGDDEQTDRYRPRGFPPSARSFHSSSRLSAFKAHKSLEPAVAPGPTPHGAEGALNTAIVANFAILISKLCVFMASGSSSILAEAVHSVVDIANQALLRTGLARSVKQPDASYNYGYRREVFVWSLISGVGIFCLGAGVSIVHGVHGLMHPNPVIEHLGASLAVLFISFVIESYSLSVAYRALAEGAKLAGMPVKQYVKLGIDPTSTSVVCEDGAAVLGLVVAAGCLMITKVTGNAAYDAVGSIVVGTLLGAVAVFLIQTNRKALIGRSLSPQKIEQIIASLRADPVVVDVIDAKSEEIGPGVYRFKAEVEFDGAAVVRRYLDGAASNGVTDPSSFARRERLMSMFQAASLTRGDTRALEAALKAYGQEMVTAVGDEVDRLEDQIRALEPSIKHVDIETN